MSPSIRLFVKAKPVFTLVEESGKCGKTIRERSASRRVGLTPWSEQERRSKWNYIAKRKRKKKHNKNETRKRETVTHFMSRFFRKKTNPYNLRGKGKLRGKNTPSARVDACVETDLLFDKSDIAPEDRDRPPKKTLILSH